MKPAKTALQIGLVLLLPAAAHAQSSSLYVTDTAEARPAAAHGEAVQAELAERSEDRPPDRLSKSVARVSLLAVKIPEPHKFAVHDLITIIISETTESDSKANFKNTKESKYDGDISSFPSLSLADLLKAQIQGGALSNPAQVAAHMKKDYNADGEASRSDTFTSRVTAEIIDVKPNGTLVVQARKFIKTDEESLDLLITGTCRKQDVGADNTVLSTLLHDLRLTKKHSGELASGTNKGWLTKLFDFILPF